MSAITLDSFELAPHVHSCCTREHVMLLDLKRDRYMGLSRADALALRSHIPNLVPAIEKTSASAESAVAELSPQCAATLAQLIELGMLVRSSASCATRTASMLPTAQQALICGYIDTRAQVRLRDLATFTWATLKVTLRMRWQPLDRIVDKLRRHSARAPATFDLDRVRRKVAIFNRLQPMAYTARNACLFNTLTMREFLSASGFAPRVVFGVTSAPFSAHCWLQQGDVVINDAPEYVREYTPILIV